MTEPLDPTRPPPVHKGQLAGGIVLGIGLFFALGLGSVILFSSLMDSRVVSIAVLAVVVGVGAVFLVLREKRRSLALGVLVGAACGLLIFGTCLAVLLGSL